MGTINSSVVNTIIAISLVLTFVACDSGREKSDAYGNFEAIEIIVSSEANGKILNFEIEEGDLLADRQFLGVIDTTQLHLQKVQLSKSIQAIQAKLPDVSSQVNVLKERLAKAKFEEKRIKNLVEAKAVTTKQLDDVKAEISLIEREIIATTSSLNIQQAGLLAEIPPVEAKIELIDDLILKSIIRSPINGTVLTKFAYSGELTSYGKPLFKIANIDELICRAYISEPQLSDVKLGDEVAVLIDSSDGGLKEYKGVITWISSKAEFTPKIIQTKEERINLVYAMKIKVANDGFLKIGMPAEVKF